MKRFMIYAGFILLLLLGSVGQVQAITRIDTVSTWDESNFISSFGLTNTATYGQVITVPITDTVLQDFSFHINLTDACAFKGYVYAWDGTKATGPALYESAATATLGSGGFEKIEFRTGGIALTAGAQYVLFASASKTVCPPSASPWGRWGAVSSDTVYGGGKFVFLNNGTDAALWTTATWSYIALDLAFTATFANSTILYWTDGVMGTDHMKQAIANIGDTYSTFATTAASLADFESKINTGTWDLVVLMVQEGFPATPKFNSYVSGGGRAILTDWEKDATRGALFGVTYTGHDNQDAVTITEDLFFRDVSNPMSLTSPGWSVFSMGMATGSGTVAATFPNGNPAIVVGGNGKTIVNGFLTDTPTSASDGVTLFENEILTLLPFKVASPNGGERVPAGGIFNLAWIPGNAVSFNVDLSTNKGSSWKPVLTQYAGSTFEWRVPLQKDNMPNCKIRVTGYDSYGVKAAQDVSDKVFMIEVLRIAVPNGGEAWTSGYQQWITWKTYETMGAVGSVQLFYALDGKRWKPIATVAGNPGSYHWTVPTVTAAASKCKVKAVLKSAAGGKGKTLATALSDGFFTINP